MTISRMQLSLISIILLGITCANASNPITSLFGKGDEKSKPEETATESKIATTTNPSSSCGGLKGFLHICEKTEPPKPSENSRTRREADSDSTEESSSESDSAENKEDEDEKKEAEDEGKVKRSAEEETKQEEEGTEESSTESSETVEKTGREKRQTEEPTAVSDAESEVTEKSSATEEMRKRRDCRDRGDREDYDCRRRRRAASRP